MGKKDKVPAYRLGIDLGGTKIYALVVDRKGRVLGSARRPTKPAQGYRRVLERIDETAHEAAADADLRFRDLDAIGLGVPGPVDLRRGLVVMAPNLGWGPKPVARDLGRLLERDLVIGNDVNFGGLGEATYGAGRGAQSSFSAFVGTGLGGALILNGRIVNGFHGFGGELGHVSAPFGTARCGCGRRGCLETTASKTGMARLIAEAEAAGVKSKVERTKDGRLRSSALLWAWRHHCPATRRALKQSARALAWGLAMVGNIFDPEVFILGGGVMEALGGELLSVVRGFLPDYSALFQLRKPTVRLAALGDDAVAMGAAVASSAPVYDE